jgi:hypothetical protein
MSRSSAQNDASSAANNAPISLERKLELLESRFTQPNVGSSSDILDQQAQLSSFGTPPAGSNDAPNMNMSSPSLSRSNSQHSFSFASPNTTSSSNPSSSSNLPSSSVRSRRRPSLSSSFHAVERAAARHLRKVAANSPVQGTSSNPNHNSSSNSSSSQQTLLTSHVHQRVVAESPPVPVTPGTVLQVQAPNSGQTMVPPKPPAARNILHTQHTTHNNTSKSSNPNLVRKSHWVFAGNERHVLLALFLTFDLLFPKNSCLPACLLTYLLTSSNKSIG